MSTTYAQKQSLTQKKDAPSASSVFDASSQSESLQRKADMVNAATQRAETPRPNNTGMPDNLKSGIESLSGFSMDDVRVHYNSPKPATVQALAYTQGTDIHVAPGQEKHLPHEAWHVAQQMAGRVSPTTNINGMPVNDNTALEHEADVMGEKAVQCKEIIFNTIHSTRKNNVAQGKFLEKTNNGYKWHDEEPEKWRYEKTDEYSSGSPVYKERVLDVTALPNKKYPPETRDINEIYTLLNDEQKIEFENNVSILQDYCEDKGITSVIEGALKNVKHGSIIQFDVAFKENEKDVKKRQISMFLNRLRLMTEYIKKVGESSYNGKIIKDQFFIESTGSDPHVAGQHALFLIPRNSSVGSKRVYKPHSLEFEKKFMGKDASFLANLNVVLDNFSLGHYKFPTMDIDPNSHTEAFVERKGTEENPINSDTFTTYMIQLGMLEIIAQKYGITDLHCENVMFTEGGPLAIDAECGGSFGKATCMTGQNAPVATNENGMSNPSALYRQKGCQLTDRGDKIGAFAYGMWLMEQIFENKEKMKEMNPQNLFIEQSELRFRIIPFDTGTLATELTRYNDDGFEKYTSQISLRADEFLAKIKQYGILRKVQNGIVYKELFEERFIKAVSQGTLPAFECFIQKNDIFILLDGVIIGHGSVNDENLYSSMVKEFDANSTVGNWEFDEDALAKK